MCSAGGWGTHLSHIFYPTPTLSPHNLHKNTTPTIHHYKLPIPTYKPHTHKPLHKNSMGISVAWHRERNSKG